MNVDEAIIAKMAWKDDGMRAYAKALLEAALRLHIRGVHFFNNDDVGPMHQPGDRTTVGAVVRLLLNLNIIEPTGVHLPDQGIRFGTRRSTRAECNGHRNPLYKLTNTAIALEWLKRNGHPIAQPQGELFAEFSTSPRSAVAAGL